MPKCPNCHGAGFTLRQVAWSMGRVRIFCKTCDGIGYTYKKVMTPTQSKQAAAIMQKHGEEGWRIEYRSIGEIESWKPRPDPSWNWLDKDYRAVRIERVPTRTPLPIEHYKRGMEVRFLGMATGHLVLGSNGDGSRVIIASLSATWPRGIGDVENWRWPNETEWHPAYTETVEEKIVETLTVEGL